jgi:phage terminase large subunit
MFNYDLFWQIQRKTRTQILLDFNPTSEFWAHSQIIKGQEAQYRDKWRHFILDHRHNPFLSEDQHKEYESISDPELFRVYARGLTGKVTGLVLGFFKQAETMPDDCDRYIWGIDYGYTNDPTALVKVGIKGRKRYFQEMTYMPGISAEEIVETMWRNGYNYSQPLYSEVDRDMIIQLRVKRINVIQAQKSIAAGLSKLKEYECFYIGSNFHIEILNYKYVKAQDLLTGKDILTNTPTDGYNHLADASRYAHYTDCLINKI